MNFSFLDSQPKLGVALSGGGVKGLAHIGALKSLINHKIEINYISGTSAGSIVGAFYAAKKNIFDIEEYILNKNRWEMLSLLTDPSLRQGIFQGKKVQEFLEGYLGKDLQFENLKLPFHAMAVDLKTGKTVALKTGSVIKAVLASSAIPMVFKPIQIDKYLLVDGGVNTPVPVEEVQKMGADVTLAINLYKHTAKKNISENINLFDIGRQTFDVMMYNISEYEIQKADLVVNPHAETIYWKSLLSENEKKENIAKGEHAMNENIKALEVLLKTKKHSFIERIKKWFR